MEIPDDNREKDRATAEATFSQLVTLAVALHAEQRHTAAGGATVDEPPLLNLYSKENINKRDGERLKPASQRLLTSLHSLLTPIPGYLLLTTTKAEVKVFILARLPEAPMWSPLPEAETKAIASRAYDTPWRLRARPQQVEA